MKNQKRFKRDWRNADHKRFEQKGKGKISIGTIKSIRGNVAYFLSDKEDIEAEISTRDLNSAMSGDKVEVKIYGKGKSGLAGGEVVRVIERAKSYFVGTVMISEKGIAFAPDDKKLKMSVKILREKIYGAKDEDKVKIKITKWIPIQNLAEGEVVAVLGKSGENSTEMNSIAIDKGFNIEFPENVSKESKIVFEQNRTISKEEITNRRDLRNTLTFTIDPKTAKDFDDAISFKKLQNGNYEIGVHIADVSYYVREKSELDKEAFKRGCSVYLPDRTIPMLPFELSDNLCSLSENDEKLSFSAIFEIDTRAKVLSKWFGRTVIKSDKRFSYESAQEILNSGNSSVSSSRMRGSSSSSVDSRLHGNDKPKYFYELDTLNKLAKIMRKEKWQKGAIDFEQEEIAFELDDKGKPIRIYKKERLDTHKLVEEFMLLANKEVAEFVYKFEKKSGKLFPLPYRIHDFPDKERITELSVFVKALGHELVIGKNGSITGKDMQALFAQVEGKAEEALVKTAAIRSMAKAIYSVKNIGHFGLAFEYYAHFTSPIRRYPDLLVHRILGNILSKNSVQEKNLAFYEKACQHSTDQEIKASEAERDARKYKQVEFMLDKVGQIFDGLITGVTEWGIYAEDTKTRAEGMIKLSSLGDDYYVFNPKKYAIVGEKTKRTFSLGQKVKIKLVSADLDRKQMDYEIVN